MPAQFNRGPLRDSSAGGLWSGWVLMVGGFTQPVKCRREMSLTHGTRRQLSTRGHMKPPMHRHRNSKSTPKEPTQPPTPKCCLFLRCTPQTRIPPPPQDTRSSLGCREPVRALALGRFCLSVPPAFSRSFGRGRSGCRVRDGRAGRPRRREGSRGRGDPAGGGGERRGGGCGSARRRRQRRRGELGPGAQSSAGQRERRSRRNCSSASLGRA
jgi:hypothetical protein